MHTQTPKREMKRSDFILEESEIPNRIDLSKVLARALARNQNGLRFAATALLTISAIWFAFGIIGFGLAGMIFR
jgi:hypothetical protein